MNIEVEAVLKTLPRKIKVGAYDWRVRVNSEPHDELCGQADFEFRNLNLWPSNLIDPAHAVGIVIHELMHIIYDDRSIAEIVSGDDKEEVEENIVVRHEQGLVALFRDNPKLLTWIKRGLKKSA